MLQLMVAGNVRPSTVLAGPSFLKRRPLPHNNSFKPNPLRYSHNMAEKACHVVASTTQVGLIRTLYGNGLVGRQFLARPDCANVWRWLRLVFDLMVAWIAGPLHILHRRLRA